MHEVHSTRKEPLQVRSRGLPGLFTKITSASNPAVKTLKSLDRKKIRAETGLFMAEGGRLVRQGLDAGWDVDCLVVTSDGKDRPHVQALADQAHKQDARLIEVPTRLMGQIARKDNPGTVLAAFRQRQLHLADLSRDGTGIWIGLYECRDPGNLGTILRTADCIGAAGVILLETCCDPYSVEAVRASMGAVFDVPFGQADFGRFKAWRTEQELQLIAASVNGTVRHDSIPVSHRAVLLMGNEQAGLPAVVEEVCDHLALIPMRPGADSLNLAQATAIMAYDTWRQQDYPGASETPTQ